MRLGIALLGILLAAACASAGDIRRCGNNLVSVGDSRFKVLQTCGRPDMRDIVGEKTVRKDASSKILHYIEKWVYLPVSENAENSLPLRKTMVESRQNYVSLSQKSPPVICGRIAVPPYGKERE